MATNTTYPKWARTHLGELRPYVPGKPIQEVVRELGLTDVIKMAGNENLLGPSKKAVKAIQEAAGGVHFYPEDTAYALRAALSHHLKVKPEALLFGNGSDEALHLCAAATLGPDAECVYPLTSFVMYPILSAQMTSTGVGVALKNWTVDLDAMQKQITKRTRLVFIPNPNNPTGTVVNDRRLKQFVEAMPPHVLVVIDEAYREIRGVKAADPVPWTKTHRNLIVTRTFSKSYGLAGCRIGYAVGHPDTIALIARLRPPFNVNNLAQAAALASLNDSAYLTRTVALIKKERAWLTEQLEKLGHTVLPSQANFLMIVFDEDAKPLTDFLLHQGIIVRPLTAFGVPNAIRVSLGKRADNQRLVKALKAYAAH